MKKAFDQTFRDIKRGVNKKVLKVPSIEQKVLDATSNEPWGPHGTHLADIAQASRNYHEYQMVMPIVWKRLSDSGKNWRHVYKALTILEYLVANGSERVIEDIREHAYQITALSSFQYIDSTGRDQGSNVRKKSQSLVALVMDKEKIQEARDKATVSRDKFRNTPGDEGRYGNNREEDRNGYGREWDDEYGGRSTSNDGDHGPRSRSSDREREDDGHRSSRGSNARVEDASPDVRVEPKVSGQNVGAPPSYEDAVIGDGSPVGVKRDGETAPAASPQVNINHQETAAPPPPAVAAMPPPPAVTTTTNNEKEVFDLFDPRGATAFSGAAAPAPPPSSGGAENEMDLLGSLSDSFSSNALALVPSTTSMTTTEIHAPANSNPYLTFDTPSPPVSSQPFDDPFGDGPFKAISSTTDGFSATSPFGTSVEPVTISVDPVSGGFGDAFDPTVDILADILPPPSQTTAFQPSQTQTVVPSQTGFSPEAPNQSYSTPFGEPPSFSSQAMPQSAFQAPGSQPMPHSVFQVPGGHQSTPQSAFQVSNGHQLMPQPALQVPASHHQYRSLPDFQVEGGQQSMPQPALQVSSGHQSMPPQSAFQVSNGHQSMRQSVSQVQGGQQSMPQSALQSIIPQPSYPGQAGQSVLQPGFAAPQNASSVGGFSSQLGGGVSQPARLPSSNGQSVSQPGFPAQSGQNGALGGFSSQLGSQGFPSSNGQPVSQPGLPAQGGQNAAAALGGFSPQLGGGISHARPPSSNGQSVLQPGFLGQGGQSGFPTQGGQHAAAALGQLGTGFPTSNNGQPNNLYGGFQPQPSSASVPPLSTPVPQYSTSNFYQQQQQAGLTASSGALALVPPQQQQQPAAADKKFETKSTVWADTLNRGLVNLNISGAKTNPLSDIGIDFEAINRKEKRMEKPSNKTTTPVTSNVSMGKAMGSGSGMGRAGAGVLRPAPNPMMAAAPGPVYGGGMGINHMPHNMGIGMGMGQMQQQAGFPPGSYNPMMGRGVGYGQQQPYGGAYR